MAIRGVEFYCTALQQTVTVVAAFHGFEADLPGRCKGGRPFLFFPLFFPITFSKGHCCAAACGSKFPAKCLGQHCPVCHSDRQKIREELESEAKPELRCSEELYQRIISLMDGPESIYKEAVLSGSGFSRISCNNSFVFLFFHLFFFRKPKQKTCDHFFFLALWKMPGARLNRQMIVELMHLEFEGMVLDHFEKLSEVLDKHNVHFPFPLLIAFSFFIFHFSFSFSFSFSFFIFLFSFSFSFPFFFFPFSFFFFLFFSFLFVFKEQLLAKLGPGNQKIFYVEW